MPDCDVHPVTRPVRAMLDDDDPDTNNQLRFFQGRTHPARPFCCLFSCFFLGAIHDVRTLIAAFTDEHHRTPRHDLRKRTGFWLWDSTGRRHLDFVQGWAVNCLGHAPAVIADALNEQARKLITPSPAFYNAPSIELATALVKNSCFDQVFFTNSASEANEGAIKLARKYGQKHRHGAFEIITFDGGFHGRTLATMSASGKKAFEPMFEPKVPGFNKAILNDIDSVTSLISEKTTAIMLEPIQGEAGVWPATKEFLQALRALTKDKGLLLIVDEIQTAPVGRGPCFTTNRLGSHRIS